MSGKTPLAELLGPNSTDAIDASDDPGLLLLEAVAPNDIPRAKAVLARHARDHARDYQHCQTIEEATKRLNPEEAEAEVPASVRDLVNNSRDADGYSAMIIALDHPSQFGMLPMVRFLLDNGADLNTVPARVRNRIKAEAESRQIATDFRPERFPQTLLVQNVLDQETS